MNSIGLFFFPSRFRLARLLSLSFSLLNFMRHCAPPRIAFVLRYYKRCEAVSLGPEPAGPLIFIGVAHLDRALAEGDLGHQRLDWRPYFVPRGEKRRISFR